MKELYFLAGVKLPGDSDALVNDSMEELENLVATAGGEVYGRLIQKRDTIDPTTYIGKGKIEEIDMLFDRPRGEGTVVFNADLSPAQIRNLEEVLGCQVITRTELILAIFAIHARSQVAKFQVETAQLSYMLPRLTGQGVSMSRTGAGLRTRGPGETKLETDRRKIHKRISLLKKELQRLEKAAEVRRRSRENVFKVTIAGYTNAGKSALSTLLTKGDLTSENKLFSTLDTATRKLSLGPKVEAVLTDTVGFIRDIPHELVESFKSTLAETAEADLIIHLVDISSTFFREKMDTGNVLLAEIGAEQNKRVLAFNKIDMADLEVLALAKSEFPEAFFISAKKKIGIEELQHYIRQEALRFMEQKGIILPEYLS
ncbi:GTP-binding protein HflX [Brevinema andersonii]|uniref:GTPase HflX n=1 Tax=Brevinema andersonii TaxID=34097 RepID=A0A1I1D549_BREAD|nr:GTPase HflX [Brevinema andersonii]SFB69466.1 GTP-binding protein HflX [Brevinema andersonii]